MTFLLLLLVLAVAGVIATVVAIHADGYGPRPDRDDSTVGARRRF